MKGNVIYYGTSNNTTVIAHIKKIHIIKLPEPIVYLSDCHAHLAFRLEDTPIFYVITACTAAMSNNQVETNQGSKSGSFVVPDSAK